jgi:hypothetical protein
MYLLFFQVPDHTYPKFTLKEEKEQDILNKDVTLEVGEV